MEGWQRSGCTRTEEGESQGSMRQGGGKGIEGETGRGRTGKERKCWIRKGCKRVG